MTHVHHLVHRQLLKWEAEARARKETEHATAPPQPHPFITVSREAGSWGSQAAALVAQDLGWQCFDREIVDYVAKDVQVEERVVASLDENVRGYIEAWVASFVDGKHVETADYLRHLARVLRALVYHEPAVIVGRGAHIVLSNVRERCLAVRVMAPLKVRVARLAEDQGVPEGTALERIRRADRSRARFLQEVLGRSVDDPMQFDLIINTERLSIRQTADVILTAARARGLVTK
ncbi:MAG: cytidylate kinase-like family protein [Armatimonadota bacterium]